MAAKGQRFLQITRRGLHDIDDAEETLSKVGVKQVLLTYGFWFEYPHMARVNYQVVARQPCEATLLRCLTNSSSRLL